MIDLMTAGLPERLALRVLQAGIIAAVLAASTLTQFDLDRFFIPKELVLHVVAVLAGLLAIRAASRTIGTRIDWLLLVYLILSALSALFATNRWLGLRALAITASALIVFWIARGLRHAGLAWPILGAVAAGVELTALTSLLQTYGMRVIFFSINRAPGGTLGNRNFVAHVAAFGFPICLLVALRARRTLMTSIGIAMVAAALVITRSRAAWLAAAVMAFIFLLAILVSAPLRRDGQSWKRLGIAFLFAVCGAGAALLLPNTLHWRGENPYLESVRGVTNYEEGSGRARLVQYARSVRMAASHPILGVGPGNWPVVFPRFVPRDDPSLNPSAPGMTFNPWPSSDSVAIVSERGFVAVIVWLLVMIGIAGAGVTRLIAARDAEEGAFAAALLATLAAAVIAGMFDAVLILPLPALLVWASLGALWNGQEPGKSYAITFLLVLLLSAFGAARSVAQLVGMEMYATAGSRAALERAARIDPGSYALHLRLARSGNRKDRCAHARAAHALFPNADGARNLAARCGE